MYIKQIKKKQNKEKQFQQFRKITMFYSYKSRQNDDVVKDKLML